MLSDMQMMLGLGSSFSDHLAQKAQLSAAAVQEKAAAVVAAHKHTLQKQKQVCLMHCLS